MRSPRELAAAAMRCLRELDAAVDLAAENAAEIAWLLTRIVSALIRVLRSLVTVVRTLATGCRVMADLVVRISEILSEIPAVFSCAGLRAYQQQYGNRFDRIPSDSLFLFLFNLRFD